MQATENSTEQTAQQKPEVIMNLSIKGGHVLHFKINKSHKGWNQNVYSLSADDKDIGDIPASDDQEAVVKGLAKISEVLAKVGDAKKTLAEYLR